MSGLRLILALAGAVLLQPVTAHAGALVGNAARGAVIVRVRCSACHFVNRPEHKLGPSLYGIFDRAPSIVGIPFKRWDARALDAWLSGPRKVKINTTMVLPPLMPQDRADVIAYFAQQKQRLLKAAVAAPGAS